MYVLLCTCVEYKVCIFATQISNLYIFLFKESSNNYEAHRSEALHRNTLKTTKHHDPLPNTSTQLRPNRRENRHNHAKKLQPRHKPTHALVINRLARAMQLTKTYTRARDESTQNKQK